VIVRHVRPLAPALRDLERQRRQMRALDVVVQVGGREDEAAGYELYGLSLEAARTIALPRRRRATAAGASPGCPDAAIASSQARVASIGFRRRARYSRAASVKSRLRDTLSRRAHASISRKRSSEIEITVFTRAA